MALRKVQIASIQTVVPLSPSDRKSQRVEVANDVRAAVFSRRFHVIVYYKKGSEEGSGWVTGGWMKETLGTAFVHHPMLCGRLLRVTNHDGNGDEFMEIVSNDSGVRLYEARVDMSLTDVLGTVHDDGLEAKLVAWEDIDQEHPEFSPLAYVQVTNFSCGGYSVGFSCSFLVMDPFTFTTFLKQWANIHNSILSKPQIPELPTFYFPNLQSTTNPILTTSIPCQDKGVSVIFKTRPSSPLINLNYDVALCIKEVENKLRIKFDKEVTFTLIIKQVSGETKAETLSRQKQGVEENQEPKERIVCEDWDDVLRADDMDLHKGNKPAHVSYWINSNVDQGIIMVIKSLDKGKLRTPSMFIVTLP